ncbi:FAD-dependent monooxygenase [Mycobacterium deserti]|uniref:FAD-dependent monooxygenase n=1 Tax=Mycobacterium deserti TaxID=2978347 RepID=A0ABT2M6Z3_9MYCO|nr:FAD-dependent monooxygenase [Mycobacterium deserti]MCT7658022.1 FAD-dependent monooxygenase [Mycobacterium deserti]
MGSIAAVRTPDVAVCGAGPVGLTSAALLSQRGLNVVVLEKNSTTSNEPKAISVDDETLRVFQHAGVADAVMDVVVPGTGTRYYDRYGAALFQARGASPFRLGHPFKNPFAQPDLERVLVEALRARAQVDLRFDTEVVDFEQAPDKVTVHTRGKSGDQSFDVPYVFGCDGGRSATRLLQGGTMTGRSHKDVWLVVDTIGDSHTERFAMHHGNPVRPHVIVPGLAGRCRYEFRLFDGEGRPEDTPAFELIDALVSPFRPIRPDQVVRAVNYRFNAVVADQWQIGRSFLLGDAAHMMPPFAGQGLNTGIRDAANLTWKIADVLDNKLDPSVLASYQPERAPHAWATVRLSEQLGRIVMTTSARIAKRRDDIIRSAVATSDGRKFLEEMRYRPTQHYTDGLVLASDDADIVGVSIGQPLAFDSRTHRVDWLDDIVGTRWTLFGVNVHEEDWSQTEELRRCLEASTAVISTREDLPCTDHQVLIDVDNGLNTEFSPYAGRFVLMRPDKFVAAAWRPRSSAEVIPSLLRWTTAYAPATPELQDGQRTS